MRVRLVLLICTCDGIIEVTTAYSDSSLMLCLLLSDFLGLTCVHQSGMTALMWAVQVNRSRSVQLVLDGGANTEIRDMVCDVMSCLVLSRNIISCHVISYDRRVLHLSEALCMH